MVGVVRVVSLPYLLEASGEEGGEMVVRRE